MKLRYSNSARPAELERIFPGESEMARRMRAFDWSNSAVGSPRTWPQNLRNALGICLTSCFPMQVWWGNALTMFYNDAYISFLGTTKHPAVLGRSASQAWPEIWETIGPLIAGVMTSGKASWSEDVLMFFDRTLKKEEVYVTFSFSPVFGRNGAVDGTFCACMETTGKIIGNRRLDTLRKLGVKPAQVQVPLVAETCKFVAGVLSENPYDLPFAAIYLVEEGQRQATLVATAGFASADHPLPLSVSSDLGAPSPWELVPALRTRRVQEADLRALDRQLPGGPWPDSTEKALVLPIMTHESMAGLLVVGISPRRLPDDAYRSFLNLVTGHIGTAIADARAYVAERRRAEALADLDRAKTTFFSNVSHELRTPLTLILGPLEDAMRDNPQAAPCLQIAHRNSLHLLKLVNALLDFSSIEAGRMQANYEPVDLAREQKLSTELVDVLESMNDIFLAFDTNWHFTYVNAAAERASGMQRDSLLGKVNWDMFPAILGSVVERKLRRAMAQRVSVKFEAYYEPSRQWFDVEAVPVRNDGLAVYASNITKRKLGEQAALQLAAIVTSSDDAIIGKTLAGTIVSWNAGAERMYGYGASEMLGRPISTLVPPEVPDETPDILERIRHGERVEHHETVRVRKDGRRIDVSLTMSPIRDASGGVSGASGIERDISERKRIEQALRESELKYRLLWETTTDAVILLDEDSKIRFANPAVEEVFGYPAEALVGQNMALLQPERLREGHRRGFRRYLETGTKKLNWRHTEMLALHRDGHEFPAEITFSDIEIRGTRLFAGFIRDISERKRAEETLRDREARIRRLVDANIIGVFFGDLSCHITEANDAFLTMTGYTREDLSAGHIHWVDMTPPQYLEADQQALDELARSGICAPFEKEYICRDGSLVPVLVACAMLEGSQNQAVGFVLDLSARKQAEERVRHMADHDALTGLPNRALLQDRLRQAISHANRNQSRVAILFIDLDYFKNINDSLGHHVGDAVLQMAASRLQKCLREGDSVARLGGDEFVLSLPSLSDSSDAARVAQKALDALAQPFNVNANVLHISGSIGISIYPDDGVDVDALMRTADTAMYHAKEMGRGNFQFFTAELNLAAQQRFDVGTRLRQALAQNEFVLHYQPQVDMVSGRTFSSEALLRWQPAGREPISCGAFIANAEESGLIVPIGEWALRQACRQTKIWQDAGQPEMKIAVNISPRQLEQADFCSMVQQILDETEIPASALELEITESILLQRSEFNLATLSRLNDMGIQLTVDDFGTGYSSLAYLQRFPVHALKIDQSFVRDIGIDQNDTALVTAIIAMASSLHMKVMAEGVETSQQAQFLLAHGCLAGQGFYYSKAVPAETLSELFRTNSTPVPRAHPKLRT